MKLLALIFVITELTQRCYLPIAKIYSPEIGASDLMWVA